MENRYFIISANDTNLDQIFAVVVGTTQSQRYSLDGLQIVVKLHKGDTNEYEFLSQYQEYGHGEILYILSSPHWTQNIEQDA
jgi:hypothetical protein